VVASELAAFAATTPGLTAIAPNGTAVGDTVYAVPLSASWVTPTLDDAAALFLAYLRSSDGEAAFAEHGLQVPSPRPAGSTGAGASPAAGSSGGAVPTGSPAGSDPADVIPDAGAEVAAALGVAIGASTAG
jgi:hypothetical protein